MSGAESTVETHYAMKAGYASPLRRKNSWLNSNMKRLFISGLCALAWIASGTLTLQAAQFAPSSLFLSQADVTEGETVLIYAVVSNENQTVFEGELAFADGTREIETVPISLAPGEARTASVSWTPLAGSHTVTAQLQDMSGSVVQEQSATFVVKKVATAQEEPTTSSPSAVESSQDIQQGITNLSEPVGSTLRPVFEVVDTLRQKGVDAIDSQITALRPKLPGTTAGSADSTNAAQDSPLEIVWTALFYLFSILRFVIASAGVFYPLLAIAFLYLLWRLYRSMTRPRLR
jgi:hypothetical protein